MKVSYLQGKVNSTPIETNHKLILREDDLKVETRSYQRLIGKLLYLSDNRIFHILLMFF